VAQAVLQNHVYNCSFVLHIRDFHLDTGRLTSALHILGAQR
jgi:hypothetical protein